jgi:hypothetical protein
LTLESDTMIHGEDEVLRASASLLRFGRRKRATAGRRYLALTALALLAATATLMLVAGR